MCGIVGFINRESNFKASEPLTKWFKQALYCDALRGEHGTGILSVNDKGFYNMYKKALNAADFLELSKTKSVLRESSVFSVGHNRWATQGTHTDDNSHPFEHGNIVLFHNGTVSNHRTFNKPTFDVDSSAISFMFSESEDIKKSIERIEGTYSLVWYDFLLETLNFARNEDRPMFFGYVKDSKSILFASEAPMIRWLANRNGIVLEKIEAVPENIWLEVPLNSEEKFKAIPFKPAVKETYHNFYQVGAKHTKTYKGTSMEGVTIPLKINAWYPYNAGLTTVTPQNGYLSGIYNDLTLNISGISDAEGKDYVGKTISVKVSNITKDNFGYANIVKGVSEIKVENTSVVPFLLQGPFKKKVTRKDFDALTKHGCAYCTTNLLPEDHEKITWDSSGDAYCEDCATILSHHNLSDF